MFLTTRFHALFLTALLWLAALGCAPAQWLIYELVFTPEEESVNFSCYNSGYLVAPANGGASTLVLTTEEGGQVYAVADGGGKASGREASRAADMPPPIGMSVVAVTSVT